MTVVAQRSLLRALAREVARWLQRIVPHGFAVEALECGIVIRAADVDDGRVVDVSPLLHHYGDVRSIVETAVMRMLDDAQDEVIETTREAWPVDGNRAAPASAYVEWHDQALSIGYRYDARAVVVVGALTIDDVISAPDLDL